MKIQTHHIPSIGLDLSFEEPTSRFESLKKLEDSSDCTIVAPLRIQLKVTPMRDFIKVKGSVETVVRQACVRCLEDFSNDLKSRFTLNYSKDIPKDVHERNNEGIELTAQQIGIIFYEDDEIDFSEALQEQIVLALPFKPLCSDDCIGLCIQCGQNLNNNECQCEAQAEDGPFAALKNIKLSSQ